MLMKFKYWHASQFSKVIKNSHVSKSRFLKVLKKKKKLDNLSINGFFRFSHIISRKNKKIKN